MEFKNKSKLAAEKVLNSLKQEEGRIEYPINPFKILHRYKVIITYSDFDNLEGLLLLDKQKDSIVAINKGSRIRRQRFTAAHELGHIVLHSDSKIDKFYCPISGKKDKIEREADDFASYLLMPDIELNKLVDQYQNEEGKVDLDNCLRISEYFGVSFECCVRTIRFRLNRLIYQFSGDKLNKLISDYKPELKRKKLFNNTSDLSLLLNALNYSCFSIPNLMDIIGIKFMQNLIYHDNKLENINVSMEKIKEIYADLRVNNNKSKFCHEKNQKIIEVLGNIEMNKYCLQTNDDINIFKIRELNKLLYKYVPYPESIGSFRTTDNLILGGKTQPVSNEKLIYKLEELNDSLKILIKNIDKYTVGDYICEVANIHYKLTVLHPFNDGNGRVARAFMNWLLRLKKLCPIYIDSRNKTQYLKALNKIDLTGDNTDLQLIIAKSIINTMAELHDSWK